MIVLVIYYIYCIVLLVHYIYCVSNVLYIYFIVLVFIILLLYYIVRAAVVIPREMLTDKLVSVIQDELRCHLLLEVLSGLPEQHIHAHYGNLSGKRADVHHKLLESFPVVREFLVSLLCDQTPSNLKEMALRYDDSDEDTTDNNNDSDNTCTSGRYDGGANGHYSGHDDHIDDEVVIQLPHYVTFSS